MANGISILNDPPQVLDGPKLLHKLIRWDQHLDGSALDCTSGPKRRIYTYQELRSCVRNLESRIQQQLTRSNGEHQRQHVVPILFPQSPGLYISQLAILQSGGAFCPIVLEAPKERINFIVDDVSADFVITTAELKDLFSWENGPTVIVVDEFPEIEKNEISTKSSRDPTPDDYAYIMYTSGTTGKPKGVAVSHLAASQSLLAHERYLPPFQRFLQFASPSFDVSVFEIFFPLTRGVTLVGCSKEQLLNDLPGMMNELEVDAVELTPSVVGSLLHRRSNAPGLKLLLTIGEPLTAPIVEEFGGSEETKTNILYGMYGPTEAAIHCTICPKMAVSAKPRNIGVPFDTVSTFIAAPSTSEGQATDFKFLPIGEQGELLLGGPQLAHGYLNRDIENKAAFVKFEGKKYYRTGDKAMQCEDGTIELFGRISSGQVKLRGQRVELAEIENAIYKHLGVRTATAIVLGSSLVVFALIGGNEMKSESVMDTCSAWLPKHMVPSEIVLLQKFPYLASGKVDKKALQADYEVRRGNQQDDSDILLSGNQKLVTDVLRDILGPFPRTMRFATAGLDSLVAIRIGSKLRSLNFNVSTIAVLQADTLSSLMRICESTGSVSSTTETGENAKVPEDLNLVLNGDAKDVELMISCTPLQSAMLSETVRDSRAYRNWVEVELAGVTDVDQVFDALQSLARSNPIMRTGFAESKDHGAYSQIVWKEFPKSKVEEVDEFVYEFDPIKDTSLRHPIRIQIMSEMSSTRILVHLHHALYDAWSLELLLDDLDKLLAREFLAERPSYRPLVEAFEDGSLKTNDWPSKDYWKDHLAHLDIRNLPNFHSKKPLDTDLTVGRLETSITTSNLESVARKLATSPQSLFQAAFALVLSSYVGSSDICFGTVFSGRTLPIDGIEEMIFPTLATLPVRTDVSLFSSLQELISELHSTNRKHLEHSSVSLLTIKSAAGIEPGRQLFDTLLIWQQTLHSYDQKRKHVKLVDTIDNLEFDLTLEIIPTIGNIEMKANYQQSIFPASQISLFLRQIEQIVICIVETPSAPLSGLFNRLEKDVLSIENEQPEISLHENTLSSPVELIAAKDPDRLALKFARFVGKGKADIQDISYSQLNTRANQMGHCLLAQKVLPDELVCICMEKTFNLYASILATAKVGAGYLPLTPDVPPERLEYILREANIQVIMTQTACRSLFRLFKLLKVIYVDEVDWIEYPSNNIEPRSSPDNISYCVFTSGSTGAPKGVLVTQGNLLGNLDVLEELYPVFKDMRLLQSCSQAFDVSVFEIFWTWRVGGCLCSAVKDVLFRDIEAAIRAFDITHLSLTPTVAALIDPKNVPSVKFLVTAGEAVTRKVFNAWADNGLWQGYGPSETTNICTVNPKVTPGDSMDNIGPPFKNTSAFVLSPGPEFCPVPRGGEGEFCFGGSQVFRGYMNQSQNIGKIIEHPDFGRLYRSGDFGRLMPDGSLAFTGRKDDQVKIRGQRVELGEVDNIMLRSHDVQDCITMVIGDNGSVQRLVCFWTLGEVLSSDFEAVQPDTEVIKRLYKSLEFALPSYMIPSALVPVSILPTTAQGKINKRLLLNHFQSLDVNLLYSISQTVRSSSEHTWTSLEKSIAEAAAKVTQVRLSELGPDTSFFTIGIDSISAISFLRTLPEDTQRRIKISDILRFPSVARLAERIESQHEVTQEMSTVSGQESNFDFTEEFQQLTVERFKKAGKPVQHILPCTPLQEAMLSAAIASPDKLYDNRVTFDIHGDIKKLKACWVQMVQRHEILRTCFVSTDMPKHPFVQVVLEEYDLQFGSVASLGEESQIINEFELQYRLDLIEINGSTKLVVAMHHALYDGVALATIYEEIEGLYNGDCLPSPISFVPFLKLISDTSLEDSDHFWSAIMKNCTPSRFESSHNLDISKPHQSSTRIQRTLAQYPLNWIEDSTKRHGTSLLAVCHTVWACILAEQVQQTDVCFGNVVSGRTLPIEGIERLVAPCFNTIPSRLSGINNITYLEAFRTFQTLNADSLPFQLTPLRHIQSRFSPDGYRTFDTLFILQQSPRELDSSIWSISDDTGAMDFPIVCEVIPRNSDDTLEIILHSCTSILSDEDSHQILEDFTEKLQTALQNPRRQMLSMLVKEKVLVAIQSRERSRRDSQAKSHSESMSEDEIKLRDIISDFTDVPRQKIGRDVSIFRLGLDSISTVQVATRLKKQGHNVLASEILAHPSIAQLSDFIHKKSNIPSQIITFDFNAFNKQHRKLICAANSISIDAVEAIRPCTAVQQGMLAQTVYSEGREYVNSMWFEMLPEVSLSRLKNAWAVASRNHEMFRTGFVSSEIVDCPFVMVTFKKETIQLPWFENEEQQWNLESTKHRLLLKPWTLELAEHDGRNLIHFKAHHALYDAQSIQMLLSDVACTYASKPVNIRPSIENVLGPILQSTSDERKVKEGYWGRQENKIMVNRFPDLTPLRVSDTTAAVREIRSEASIIELETRCRELDVTMQAASQSAWGRLLALYIGEVSTTFGMIMSGRSISSDADNISFPSIVTLPVRCDITGTNAQLLERTMNSNARLHKHQFTPLISIQKGAGHPEGKIFDTLFAYQKLPDGEDDVELLWRVVKEEAFVDYAVSLELQPLKSGKLAIRLTFRKDMIPEEHAEILLRQYDSLLLDILRNPQNNCDVAPQIQDGLLSITPAKQDVLHSPVNLVHGFVERGAREWPHKKALEFASSFKPFSTKSWTYQELDHISNKLANYLLSKSLSVGGIVAICFEKCPEASIAIIAILKTGCAYVALDPNAPGDRLKYILDDSETQIVLTTGKPREMLEGLIDTQIVKLDSMAFLDEYSTEQPTLGREILPQDTAYCLYTSGTTGTPKGCLITHENTVQFMLAFSHIFEGHWANDSKYLQFASFHFDVSVMEQFWSWSVGICVASAPRDLIFEDITGAINQLRITHLDLTPSLARLLHPNDVPSLLTGAFITGGEQLKQEILDIWGEHAVIYNGYGPTEVTIGCTMYPRVPKNGKPSNIGEQYINVGSFVLQPGTEIPVLRGGIGELCVSGKLVGKGYLKRPDLTSEKFPTLESCNERVYRTGDLVRILHDGTFIFLGRADDQVKLRGQRLELSEINEVIKKSTANTQEVVTLVLKHDAQQKEQLITFFVAPDDQDLAVMRDACKSRLPSYMVPTHFIPIKALPLSPNNKADSKQLATLYNELTIDDLQKLSQSRQQDRKWTEKEMRIVKILAEAFHVEMEAIIPSTNIFELGLDSISIIGFSRRLQNAGLLNAKLSLIRSNPLIDGLVMALSNDTVSDLGRENAYIAASQKIMAFSQKHMASVCDELGVDSSEIESVAPCTPVQAGMIYRFLETETALYFNKFEFIFNDLDSEKLLRAWNTVAARLEVLRTRFVPTDDGFAQVVMRYTEVSWQDYENMKDKNFSLKNPWHINIKTETSTMILGLFHGLYDGNSLVMLLRCVVDEYRERDAVDYGPSFNSSLPYGPLASMPGAQEFWTSHLKDWIYQPMPSLSESSETFAITSIIEDLTGFEDLRKDLSVAPQAIIQAAWLSVLQTIIPPDLTVGIVTSGRAIDFPDAEKVIGPLFNTIPFHIKIENGTSAAELVSKCHELNMQMQDFQHTSLTDIQKWSSAKPGQQLFDTLFVFQRPDEQDQMLSDGLWIQKHGEQVADYPLAFEATLSPDSKQISLTIAGRTTFIIEADASKLLKLVEGAFQDMLKYEAQNIILTCKSAQSGGSNITAVSSQSQTATSTQHGPFSWTHEAQTMRTEIASLARIDEDSVNELSSIFEFGLDSIDVIKLSTRLKKHGVNISVSSIIRSQAIAKMAQMSSSKLDGCRPSEELLPKLQKDLHRYLKAADQLPEDLDTVLPATPLQQSMVNMMENSGYEQYFNVELFEIQANVDIEKLLKAISSVIISHPILRTTFARVDSPALPVSYAQVVHLPGSILQECFSQPQIVDISEFDNKENVFSHLLANCAADMKSKASISRPLIQIRHLQSKDDVNYLVIGISHALYDGTSLRAIHNDIRQVYQGNSISRPDYQPYLEQVLHSTTEEAKRFWKNTLSNYPTMTFPRKEDFIESDDCVYLHSERSSISLEKAEDLCKTLKISLQTLAQTCWTFVLSHIMGQLDVAFGTVLSCRDTEEAEDVLFPLMNTVAVRSVIHGTLAEMLRYMQDLNNDIRQYQHFPLGIAQAYALSSRLNQAQSDTTLFDTLFIYQGRRSTIKEQPLYVPVHGISKVEYLMCAEMEIVDDEIIWTVANKPIAEHSFEAKGVVLMLNTVLCQILMNPHAEAVDSGENGYSICGLRQIRFKESGIVSSSSRSTGVEEWSGLEIRIRHALSELSDVPEASITRHSTIFHLGLDSILVLKLPVLLAKHGVVLGVADILRHQTIAGMAKAVPRSFADLAPSDCDRIIRDAMEEYNVEADVSRLGCHIGTVQYAMPATSGQFYMVRKWQASQGAMFYQSFSYTIPGHFKMELMATAWKNLQERHDILRTGFFEIGPKLFQIIHAKPNDIIYRKESDLSATRTSPNLERPPVNLLIQVSESMTTLILVIHHALYDGISLPILIDELQALYNGQRLAPSQPKAFYTFIAQTISSQDSRKEPKQIWQRFVSDRQHATVEPVSLKRTEVYRPSTTIQDIKQRAQNAGVSIDALFLAGIAKFYSSMDSCYEGRKVVFGVYLANRAPYGEDISSLAIPTLNILPLAISDTTCPLEQIAQEIQNSLQNLTSADMCSDSLAQIHEWTGVKIDLVVNILKSSNPGTKPTKEGEWQAVQNLSRRAEVVDEILNKEMVVPQDGRCDAYLPSIDVEMRYDGSELDVGVFAPNSMLGVQAAERLVDDFLNFWK